MTGRRTGLRKGSKKGIDSSNENLQSTCESTAESESELTVASEEPLKPSESLRLEVMQQHLAPAQRIENDLETTPRPSDLVQQLHDAIQCQTADDTPQPTAVTTSGTADSMQTNICRTLPTKNANEVWVMTCPTNTQSISQTEATTATTVGLTNIMGEAVQKEMPRLQRQQSTIEHDAECAAGLLLNEAQTVLLQEKRKQQADDELKLCMNNKEIFNERERVAKYILEAPPRAALVVQQQLDQAIAEYGNKPKECHTAPTSGSTEPNKGMVQPRLRRMSSLEMERQPTMVSSLHVNKNVAKVSKVGRDVPSKLAKQQLSTLRLDYPPYNPMRIKSPAGRLVNETRREARRAEYDRIFGKPPHGQYPSSDTDYSDEYTTSQEDEETVENRFAGGHSTDDWRDWPWEKMRQCNKLQKRRTKDAQTINASNKANDNAERLRRLEDSLTRAKRKILANEAAKEPQEAATKSQAQLSRQRQLNNHRNTLSGDDDIYATANEEPATADERTAKATPYQLRSRVPQRTTTLRSEQLNRSNNAVTRSQAKNVAPVKFMDSNANSTTAFGSSSRVNCVGDIVLEVPIFTGGNWATFLNQFENVAEYYGWTEREKAVCLHNAIRGDAANALSVADSKHWTFKRLVEHMEMRHGRNRSYGDVVIDLMNQVRKNGQDLSAWHDQVQNVVNTGNLTEEQERLTAFFGFIYGLRYRPSLFNKVLSRVTRPTLEEAFYQAKLFEKDNGAQGYSGQFDLPLEVNAMKTAEPSDEQKKVVSQNPTLAMANAVEAYRAPANDTWAPAVEQLMEHMNKMGNRLEKRFDELDVRVRHLERVNNADNANNNRGRGRGFRGGNRGFDNRQNNADMANYRREFNRNYEFRERSNERDNEPRRGGFRGRGRGNYQGRGGGPATQNARNDTRNWRTNDNNKNNNDNKSVDNSNHSRQQTNADSYQE